MDNELEITDSKIQTPEEELQKEPDEDFQEETKIENNPDLNDPHEDQSKSDQEIHTTNTLPNQPINGIMAPHDFTSNDIPLCQQKPSLEEKDDFKDLKVNSELSDSKVQASVAEDFKDSKENKKNFCNQCNRSFANLKRHIDSVHEGVKKHKCESCQVAYSDKRSLQNHNIKKHQASF